MYRPIQLNIEPSLSPGAIQPLQTALTDPDKDVRESAQSAPDDHLPRPQTGSESDQPVQKNFLASHKNPTKRRFRNGCLFLLGLFFVPYIFNALILSSGNMFNRVKWQMCGSSSYTATVELTALTPFTGPNKILVKDGKLIAAANSSSVNFTKNTNLDESFDEMTVESMFSEVKNCIIFFPLLTCTFRYDSNFGYPEEVEINCPIPDACYTHLWVDNLEINKP